MNYTHSFNHRTPILPLKQDRKRLKAEKFDLLTQMKQLYSTLEDKEEELREFIRNYEQKMKESDETLKQMSKEREEMEQERWNILKRARDEAEGPCSCARSWASRTLTSRSCRKRSPC
ncbi:hypothetical protein CEXT_141001 [Caerostris extrusa]|uniref:Kazrin N-terminal domain-containing protein n=1 Tax=Caerostris extrusa TaxID=172846 RepID=A0AAV4QGT6_CAEEX|nr:hypothetical protein CEXT_141001 [Caerostris extrusa]